MLRLFVTYTAGTAEQARAFYEEVVQTGVIEKTRQEKGCLQYEYFFSADRENEILLIEKWENEADQQFHLTQEHMAGLGTIKEKHGIVSHLERF